MPRKPEVVAPPTPTRRSARQSLAAPPAASSPPPASKPKAAPKSKAKPRVSSARSTAAATKAKTAAAEASKKPKSKTVPEDDDDEELTDLEEEDIPKKNGTAVGLKRKRPSVGRPRGSVAGGKRKDDGRTGLNPLPMPPLHSNSPRTLFIFGTGDMGALGLGTEELGEINRPRLHKWFEEGIKEGRFGGEGKGIEEAVAGGMHTLVIDEAGKVWSWGVNDHASLGRLTSNVQDPDAPEGTFIEAEVLETEPMLVSGLQEEEFRAVKAAAGDSISVVVGEEGDVRAWGSFRSAEGLLGFNGEAGASKTQFSPIPLPSISHLRFTSVTCGTDHVIALTIDGTVYVWGNGQQNQLGRRIIERRKLNGLSPERLALRNIVLIGAGSYHSFAVNKEGKVFAWGLNSLGQCGVSKARGGEEDIVQIPTLIDALDPELHGGAKVVEISGGEHHTLFLLDNGEVWACGRCDGAQLGLGESHPAMVELKERADEAREKVTAETGMGAEGSGTNAPAVDEFIPEPVQIYFPPAPTADEPAPDFAPYPTSPEEYTPRPMVSISAGTRHNLAVSKDGNVYAWGYGNQCQLGLGPETETAPVPARVRSKGLNDYKVLTASAGGLHCVLVAVRKTD